jgi:hypothetical protein
MTKRRATSFAPASRFFGRPLPQTVFYGPFLIPDNPEVPSFLFFLSSPEVGNISKKPALPGEKDASIDMPEE